MTTRNYLINVLAYAVDPLGIPRAKIAPPISMLYRLMKKNDLDGAVDYAKSMPVSDEMKLSDIINSYCNAVSNGEIKLDGIKDEISLIKALTLQSHF